MDIHKIVEATLQITEEEMVTASEPMVEEPMAQEPMPEEPGAGERPEITAELIASLTEQIPELAEVDVDMLIKGMNVEMEHFETVGGDPAIIAKITFDHMKEFPNVDYYAALAEMESGLQEPAPEEGMEEEGSVVEPGGDATLPPKADSPFEAVEK
jgi:hypothetical protein